MLKVEQWALLWATQLGMWLAYQLEQQMVMQLVKLWV